MSEQDELVALATDVRRYLAWHDESAGPQLWAGRAEASEFRRAVPHARRAEPSAAPRGSETPPRRERPSPPGADPDRARSVAGPSEGAPGSRDSRPARSPELARAFEPPPRTARPSQTRAPFAEPPSPVPAGATLDEVRRALGDCERCGLCAERSQIVFGVGNPRAELVFVGEKPGADDDRQGVPFVGPSGELLDKMIRAMGFTRDEVYLCNVVKCRPPGDRRPAPAEIAACAPFLRAQLAALQPKVVVALGEVAVQALIEDQTPISALRGRWYRYGDVPLMPTYHPAFLLRKPEAKREVWADLQQVMKVFGKTPTKR